MRQLLVGRFNLYYYKERPPDGNPSGGFLFDYDIFAEFVGFQGVLGRVCQLFAVEVNIAQRDISDPVFCIVADKAKTRLVPPGNINVLEEEIVVFASSVTTS